MPGGPGVPEKFGLRRVSGASPVGSRNPTRRFHGGLSRFQTERKVCWRVWCRWEGVGGPRGVPGGSQGGPRGVPGGQRAFQQLKRTIGGKIAAGAPLDRPRRGGGPESASSGPRNCPGGSPRTPPKTLKDANMVQGLGS